MPALPGRVADTWVDEGTGGGSGGTTVHNLLTGRSVADTHPTSSITDLDAELAALIALTEKGAANGVATLDAGSKIPAAQIPALALSEFLGTVASEAAMLALVGQRGDWAIRTDLDPDSIFILETDDPTQAANWTNVTGPGVVSVDGNTGAITAGQLLTAILTVDGPGSGLNADLLDGLSSAAFETPAGAQAKADAKVAQTITDGVTTSAPSENAVFDALATKAPLVAAGSLLAIVDYHPASVVTYTDVTNVLKDMDATNLAVTFIAPPSGKVLVRQTASIDQESSVYQEWNIREGAGNVAGTVNVFSCPGVERFNSVAQVVTGLTPGNSYTWKWGFRRNSGASQAITYAGAERHAVMEVYAAPF